MSRHDPVVTLKHMRDAAQTALSMARGRTRDDLDSDPVLEPALQYQMIRVGSGASHLPREVMERSPRTPWDRIAGMTERFVTNYDTVTADDVWEATTQDIPDLLEALKRLIAEIEAERETRSATV